MRSLRLGIVLAVALCIPLAAAHAQAAPAGLQPTAELLTATAAVSPVDAPSHDPATLSITSASVREGTRKEGVTLMIVGAAGMITGLLIDESAITILSAGLAGLGLYLYVR